MPKWDEGVDGCENGEDQSERYWTFDVEKPLERGLNLSALKKTVRVACDLLIFGKGGWEKKGRIWNNLLSNPVTSDPIKF